MSFGNYTIYAQKQDTTSVSSTRRTSQKPVKSSKSSYSKIAEQKKIKNEELKKQLEQEQHEYEMLQQRLMEEQQYAYEDMFIDNPFITELNLAFIATTANYQSGRRYNQVKGSFNAGSVNFNKNNNAINFNSLSGKGLKYSTEKGQKLARDMASHSVGFTSRCSQYVRQGLQRTNLYNGHTASAYQMAGVLGKNKNFQEISPNSVDLKNLPAGCILVYDRGAARYNQAHGHIEVTLGDGTACSDGRTYNVRRAQNMRIFIPVENA